MKEVVGMSIFLGQLPAAELARLKAELAETLIANFCYPRFFDHRTASLRMRPVDRAKRQEVWLYLSSVDFSAWNRVDLMSPDFQRQIERLIIYFVQRNRSFFGQQGRKRMSDVRVLITSCAALVTEGLRKHLMSRQPGNPAFGSPRPVASWSTTNGSGAAEPTWEQIASATLILQQQLQELRGEAKALPSNEVPAAPSTPTIRRTGRTRKSDSSANGATVHEISLAEPLSIGKSAPPLDGHTATPLPGTKNAMPANAPENALRSTIVAPPVYKADAAVPTVDRPTVPTPVVDVARESTLAQPPVIEQSQPSVAPVRSTITSGQPWKLPQTVPPLQTPQPPRTPTTGVATSQPRNPALANEDVAIFEQMRQQLIVWLRIETVRLGLDISGQTPLQLLELLRQQRGFDETRLQVVSTLLNLSNQVIKNGEASLFDYKQGLMFYLIHTQQ